MNILLIFMTWPYCFFILNHRQVKMLIASKHDPSYNATIIITYLICLFSWIESVIFQTLFWTAPTILWDINNELTSSTVLLSSIVLLVQPSLSGICDLCAVIQCFLQIVCANDLLRKERLIPFMFYIFEILFQIFCTN